MRIDIVHHAGNGLVFLLEKGLKFLEGLAGNGGKGEIMAALDELKAKVEEVNTVSKSAVTLIQGLAEKLKDAGSDPVKLKELADSLDAQSDALAEAVTANTHTEEEEEPVP